MKSSIPRTFAMWAELRSLSMTPSTPRRAPLASRTTGIPPPPPAMTTAPLFATVSMSETSTMCFGRGEGTT